MKCEPSEDDPFSFEGPEIYKCTGCAVNWKQGKNLTVKTVKKKQKHKSKGNVRTVTKTVKNDSFFNFFDPVSPLEIYYVQFVRSVSYLFVGGFLVLIFGTCFTFQAPWQFFSCLLPKQVRARLALVKYVGTIAPSLVYQRKRNAVLYYDECLLGSNSDTSYEGIFMIPPLI